MSAKKIDMSDKNNGDQASQLILCILRVREYAKSSV
jgi:hypothetical protein